MTPIRKFIPRYASLPLLLTGMMQLLVYYGQRLLVHLLGFSYHDWSIALDARIPLIPVFSLVYFGSFLWWIFFFLKICSDGETSCYRLIAADFVAKLICLAFFLCIPTTVQRPSITGTDIFSQLMRFLYWVDEPNNLFPSMHCMTAWLCFRPLFDCEHLEKKNRRLVVCGIGTLLICLSTLFTKQHVFVDVFGGIAAAEIGYAVAKHTPLPKGIAALSARYQRTRLANYI